VTINEGVLKNTLNSRARKALQLTILRLKADLDRLAANFAVFDITLKFFDAEVENHRYTGKAIRAFKEFFDLFHRAKNLNKLATMIKD
jgi:hypothetical protein